MARSGRAKQEVGSLSHGSPLTESDRSRSLQEEPGQRLGIVGVLLRIVLCPCLLKQACTYANRQEHKYSSLPNCLPAR